MTDEDDELPPGYTTVRFAAREEILEKLTTAAATQGVSLDHAINIAMQHYELALSAKPGQVLRWHDADDEVRRLYMVPGNLSRWENVATFSITAMILDGPLMLLSPWFYTVWVGAGLALILCWAAMKVRT